MKMDDNDKTIDNLYLAKFTLIIDTREQMK